MKILKIIQFRLAVFFFIRLVDCFFIESSDRIALEPETVVVSDKYFYLPLGWPSEIFCDSAEKLREINVANLIPKWRIRYPESTFETYLENGDHGFNLTDDSLQIPKVNRSLNGAIIECSFIRSGNITLISRYRVKIQDCVYQFSEDTSAYNLHNPCAYGKCTEKDDNSSVECICFNQYTGQHCDKLKAGSWFAEILPYSIPAILIALFYVLSYLVPLFTSNRKQEKTMAIAQLVGFSNRNQFKLMKLYPFIRKLRHCKFPDKNGKEDNKEKYKRLKKRYEKLKARAKKRTARELSEVTAAGTGSSIGTSYSMESGNVTGYETPKIANFHKVESKRTNRKKKHSRKKHPIYSAETAKKDTESIGTNEAEQI